MHPFLFERMIGAVDPAARPGEVVNIYDKTDAYFGRGLFNPRSRIVVRVLTHAEEPVDDAFWHRKIEAAAVLRRALRLDEVTDAYRLVHAEGDGLSGLVVDRLGDCVVCEFFALGMFERRELLSAALLDAIGNTGGPAGGRASDSDVGSRAAFTAPLAIEATGAARPVESVPAGPVETRAARRGPRRGGPTSVQRVVFRADHAIQKLEGFRVPPADGAARTQVHEHGVRYFVDLAVGHKTGFFCDQRENRLRFARLCADATVLDLCCYTGGFGLSAKRLGPARDVTCVDLDEEALAVARDNANLNQARLELVHADAFVYMRQMIANGRQYDAVVLDPPKLAMSREQFDEALRKYFDLNQLAVQLVRPGGFFLTCSCSGLVSRDDFVSTVHRAATRARRTLQMFDLTGAGADHPVMLSCPESAYLKALWARVV
ncbi:MAG: class I SAM-dependent rRNA methyltransferase [Phycisphaerae bacterium]